MKRKFILTLSIASLLCLGSVASLSSCETGGGSNLNNSLKFVTVSQGEGYTISGLDEDGYNPGDTVNFTVTVTDSNKQIKEVKAKDTLLTPKTDGSYSFKIGNEDIVITVTLENKTEPVETATVTVKDGIVNGTVKPSKTGQLEIGTEVEIIAIPNDGYRVDKYFLNDVELDGPLFNVVSGKNEISATFAQLPPEVKFGSVEVLSDEVTNGTIKAKLEDGTTITSENRRLPVGTKVILEVTPQDECYELKEIKLNETVLEAVDGKFSFEVIEGRNYISGSFGLIHPGQGLVKLESEPNPEYCDFTIDKEVGKYYDVDEEITITVTPKPNFVVKSVTVNGVEIEEIENSYTFKVSEGLNVISVEVMSVAESIEIIPDEEWIYHESSLSADGGYYYIAEGQSYELKTVLSPEGSFDNIIWSVGTWDGEFIEVSEDGVLTGLKANPGQSVTVYATLENNEGVSDSLTLRVVKPTQITVETLKNKLLKAQDFEVNEANKTHLTTELKESLNEDAVTTNYNFESYSNGHSITKVTDSNGVTTNYYRAIVDDTFYALKKDGLGNTTIANGNKPVAITEENREEYQTKVNSFGAIEFDMNEEYSGVIDFMYENVFGDDSFYEDEEVFAKTVTTTNGVEFEVYTEDRYNLFGNFYTETQINMKFTFDYFDDDKLVSASYERIDYDLNSEDEEITAETPYYLYKYDADLTYQEKLEEEQPLFDLDDYFYSEFDAAIYTDIGFTEGKVEEVSEDKFEVIVGQNYYLGLENVSPSSAMEDLDPYSISTKDSSILSVYDSNKQFVFNDEGEATITIKTKNVTKTITLVAKYVSAESVEFDSSLKTDLLTNERLELKAIVLPEVGVKDSGVTYSIKESTSEGAKIDGDYLVAGTTAGEITVIATSKDNPSVSAEKTFNVVEMPSVLDDLDGKKYTTDIAWTDYSNWVEHKGSYAISFFKEAEKMKAKVEITIDNYDWLSDDYIDTDSYSFVADVTQQGEIIAFDGLTEIVGEETEEMKTMVLSLDLNSDYSFNGFILTLDDDTYKLEEAVDIVSLITDKTYVIEWGDLYGYNEYSASITFKMENGLLKADISYTETLWVDYPSEETNTGKFTATVTQSGSTLKFSDVETIEGTIELPISEVTYEVGANNEVTLSID